MKTVVIRAATASTSSLTATFRATAGAVRMRRCAYAAKDTYTAAGRRLRSAVSSQREALNYQLQEFALELLAMIVLMAIFMAMTAPETCEYAGTDACCPSNRWLAIEGFARSYRVCVSLVERCCRDLAHHWTKNQDNLDIATKSFRALSVILYPSTPQMEKQS